MPGQYPGLEKYASQFIKKHRNALVGAGLGALLSGTVGALGTRGGKYETDEELNRRRWRNGIIAGILGAGVGGLAGNYISNNQKIKQHSKIIADKTKELKSKLVPQKATQPVSTPTPTETPITPSYNNSAKPSAAVTTPKEVPAEDDAYTADDAYTSYEDYKTYEAYKASKAYRADPAYKASKDYKTYKAYKASKDYKADDAYTKDDYQRALYTLSHYGPLDPTGSAILAGTTAGVIPGYRDAIKSYERIQSLKDLEKSKTKDLFDKRTALENKYGDYRDKTLDDIAAAEKRRPTASAETRLARRLLAYNLAENKIEKINKEIESIRKPIFGEIDAINSKWDTNKATFKTFAKKGWLPALSTGIGTYLTVPAINYLYKNISN